MITGMGVQRGEQGQSEPQPRRGHVRSHQENAQKRRKQVGEDVFDRMTVDGGDSDGSRPFVVLLVDRLVQITRV